VKTSNLGEKRKEKPKFGKEKPGKKQRIQGTKLPVTGKPGGWGIRGKSTNLSSIIKGEEKGEAQSLELKGEFLKGGGKTNWTGEQKKVGRKTT